MPTIGASSPKIQSLCVYCGSKAGNDPDFAHIAVDFGRILANHQITLVYGGGAVGLMGLMARSTLSSGGTAIGIIPEHLDQMEITQPGLTELHIVQSMHLRKQLMFEKSDAFIALPGSIGTIDELIEIITWRQLGLHDKPVIIVNLKNYWGPFITLIDHVIAQGFATMATRRLFDVVTSIDDVIPLVSCSDSPRIPDRSELI